MPERVYQAVAQKRPWYFRSSRGRCIATAIHASILLSHLRLCFFPSDFPAKIFHSFLTSVCDIYSICFFLIYVGILIRYCSVKSTNYKVPHNVIFPVLVSSILSLSLSLVIMNLHSNELRFSPNNENFLAKWETVSFLRRTVLDGFCYKML
jgi:hypothetical protein